MHFHNPNIGNIELQGMHEHMQIQQAKQNLINQQRSKICKKPPEANLQHAISPGWQPSEEIQRGRWQLMSKPRMPHQIESSSAS